MKCLKKQWNGRWTFPLSQAWVFEPQFASAVKKRVVRIQFSCQHVIQFLFCLKKAEKGKERNERGESMNASQATECVLFLFPHTPLVVSGPFSEL